MDEMVKRVAVIGPESSGKSELCRQLALHFNTHWVPEYARTYLSQLDRSYTLEDIIEIYRWQFRQEQELIKTASKYLFTDTEFIIANVWCEHVFKQSPGYIREMIQKHPYDLYLLTSPDLPWEFDPLRENPGKGEFFFEWYQTILKKHRLNFEIVSGHGEERTACAISIIETSKHLK